MSAILLAQLYAIRAQAEAAILQMEHAMGDGPQEPESPPRDVMSRCPHPEDKQVDGSTLGSGPLIHCAECQEDRPGVFQP